MATAKKQTPQTVKGRVLMDGTWGRVNQVIDILPSMVEEAEQSGQVDTHPDAVAYAESLRAE
jgi:hypothetical protein